MTKTEVKVVLFFGFRLSTEWKARLKESVLFQQAQILRAKGEYDLQIVRYEGKDYLGYYINDTEITVKKIKDLEFRAQERIEYFCPDIRTDTLTFILFPHMMVC